MGSEVSAEDGLTDQPIAPALLTYFCTDYGLNSVEGIPIIEQQLLAVDVGRCTAFEDKRHGNGSTWQSAHENRIDR